MNVSVNGEIKEIASVYNSLSEDITDEFLKRTITQVSEYFNAREKEERDPFYYFSDYYEDLPSTEMIADLPPAEIEKDIKFNAQTNQIEMSKNAFDWWQQYAPKHNEVSDLEKVLVPHMQNHDKDYIEHTGMEYGSLEDDYSRCTNYIDSGKEVVNLNDAVNAKSEWLRNYAKKAEIDIGNIKTIPNLPKRLPDASKFEFTDESIQVGDKILHRIKASEDFGTVKEGDLGGFIESKDNLSQKGNSWITDNAMVYGEARVWGDALVMNNAEVSGNAEISDNAVVKDNAKVYGNAKISDNAVVKDNAKVYEEAQLYGNAEARDNAQILGSSGLGDKSFASSNAIIHGAVVLGGTAWVDSEISGDNGLYFHTRVDVENRMSELKQDISPNTNYADLLTTKSSTHVAENTNDIVEDIHKYFKTLSDEENLKRYLQTAAAFPKYNPYNTVLIQQQMPNAVQIEGEKAWEQLGHTITDKNGITILASQTEKRTTVQQMIDPKTKLPIFDDNGNPIMENITENVTVGYEQLKVYDISQTSYDVSQEINAKTAVNPKVDIDKLGEAICNNKFIDNDKEHSVKAALYDMAVEELQLAPPIADKDMFKLQCSYYAVCEHFGMDMSKFSIQPGNVNFDDPNEVESVLKDANKCLKNVIDNIEKKCFELEKKVDLSKEAPETPNEEISGKDVSEDIINVKNLHIDPDREDVFYKYDDLGGEHTEDIFSETVRLREELKATTKRAENAENKCMEQSKTIIHLRGVIDKTNAILNANPKLLNDFKAAKAEFAKTQTSNREEQKSTKSEEQKPKKHGKR